MNRYRRVSLSEMNCQNKKKAGIFICEWKLSLPNEKIKKLIFLRVFLVCFFLMLFIVLFLFCGLLSGRWRSSLFDPLILLCTGYGEIHQPQQKTAILCTQGKKVEPIVQKVWQMLPCPTLYNCLPWQRVFTLGVALSVPWKFCWSPERPLRDFCPLEKKWI